MLRRSQVSHRGDPAPPVAFRGNDARVQRVLLPASFANANLSEKRTRVEDLFLKAYGVPGKPLQVDTVLSLAQCNNTFLLAGTGFGKTRIAELYLKLFQKSLHPIVLVLNPLDALGDNQVSGFWIVLCHMI